MFGENLKKYRKKLNMSRESLAYRVKTLYGINCTNANIQSWETGTNPKIGTIIALCDILGIPEQYIFDDSPRAIDMIIKDKMPTVQNMLDSVLRVDMLSGYVGAGSVGHLVGMDGVSDVLYVDRMMVEKKYRSRDLKSLIVIGDSMRPYVDTGEIVIFTHLKNDAIFTDGKYVIETANGVMVKNLSFKCNGDIHISSCNKVYSEEIIKSHDTQEYLDIVGVVVGRILKN